MRLRSTATLLICVSSAAGLPACGNQGSSASTAPTTGVTEESVRSSRSPSSSGRTSAQPPGAAAFITPQGDNSIPEYGSEASSSEKADATSVLRGYLQARARDDWSAACGHMGATVRGQLEVLARASGGRVEGCERSYALLAEKALPSERANPLAGNLAAFRVKGKTGFALFYGSHDQQYMIPMVSEGGAWKVSQVAPVAYPIGAP